VKTKLSKDDWTRILRSIEKARVGIVLHERLQAVMTKLKPVEAEYNELVESRNAVVNLLAGLSINVFVGDTIRVETIHEGWGSKKETKSTSCIEVKGYDGFDADDALSKKPKPWSIRGSEVSVKTGEHTHRHRSIYLRDKGLTITVTKPGADRKLVESITANGKV